MKNELIFIGMVNTLTDAYLQFLEGKVSMTIGCKYQVADFRDGLYILDDDNGLLITLSKEDFMSVEDWRNKRIDLLIGL
jgi:hypothetical protein